MSNAVSTGRNRTLDVAKGIAIIGVVMTHMIQYRNQPFGVVNPLSDFLFAGLVLFFLVSGYCYKPRSYKENVIKRVKQLVIALVVCTVVLTSLIAVVAVLYGYNVPFNDYLNTIYQTLIGKNAFQPYSNFDMPVLSFAEVTHPYYFIWLLVFGFVIFYAVAERSTKDWKHVLSTIVLLTTASFLIMFCIPFRLPFYIQTAPVAAAFMVMGLYFKKTGVIDYIDCGFREVRYWAVFAIVVIATMVIVVKIPTLAGLYRSVFGLNGAWSVFTYVLVVTACGLTYLFLSSFIAKLPKISDAIRYVGTHTLAILLLHMAVAKLISMQFHTLNLDRFLSFGSIPEAIAVGLITLALCLICAEICPRLVEYIKSKIAKMD